MIRLLSELLTSRYEESVASTEFNPIALFDGVTKENVSLFTGEHPLFVQLQVTLRRWDQPENLTKKQHLLTRTENQRKNNYFKPIILIKISKSKRDQKEHRIDGNCS